jgi:hypothetical protein
MSGSRLLNLDHRARVALIGTLALFVALVATAFAIGGSGSSHPVSSNASAAHAAVANGLGVGSPPEPAPLVAAAGVPTAAAPPALAFRKQLTGRASATGGEASAGTTTAPQTGMSDSATATDASASLEATKIVKTGELTLRVDKSQVQSIVGRLATLATAQGGYVSSSSTDVGSSDPSGEVVLRVPVAHFTDAINAAEELGGHVLSLTTSADDVTGHYVDLAAKQHALERTRATYLTILGRATTIGATLAVQDRIEGVQEQIDSLTGQLKLLSSQASYSTLTVDVTPNALVFAAPPHRHGLSKAWHTSWSRFGRGIDSIVSAIGPLVLALLIMAVVAGVGVVGYRGVRKATS